MGGGRGGCNTAALTLILLLLFLADPLGRFLLLFNCEIQSENDPWVGNVFCHTAPPFTTAEPEKLTFD